MQCTSASQRGLPFVAPARSLGTEHGLPSAWPLTAKPHLLRALRASEAMEAALAVEPMWEVLCREGRLAFSSTCTMLRTHFCSRIPRVCAQLPAGDSDDQRRLAALVGKLPQLRHMRAAAPSRRELLALLRLCAHCRPGHVLCASFLWVREREAGTWEVLPRWSRCDNPQLTAVVHAAQGLHVCLHECLARGPRAGRVTGLAWDLVRALAQGMPIL